jgi:hypothetical protein
MGVILSGWWVFGWVMQRSHIKGKHNNIDFMTLDLIDNFNDMDGFIFFDFPRMTNKYVKKVFQTDSPKYLVIFESQLIRIDNWDAKKRVFFKRIFTWSDDIENGKKYIKLNLSQKIIKDIKSPTPASLFNNK